MGVLLGAVARLNGIRRAGVSQRVWLDPRAHIAGDVRLGARSRISRGCEIHGPVEIGNDSFLNRDVYVRAGTRIGVRVAIGPFCRLVTDSHDIGSEAQRAGRNTSHPVTVGDGAWLGVGVTVLPGVTIGAGSVIAAGSVVTRDVPPNRLAAGAPARVIRSLSP